MSESHITRLSLEPHKAIISTLCARVYTIATIPFAVLELKLLFRYSSYTRLTPDTFTRLHLSLMQQTNCQAVLSPSHAGAVVGRTEENSTAGSFVHVPIEPLDCKTPPQPHGGFPRVSWQCTVFRYYELRLRAIVARLFSFSCFASSWLLLLLVPLTFLDEAANGCVVTNSTYKL